MEQITKDTAIAEVLRINPQLVGVLEAAGMHCIGCGASGDETLEMAAMVHDIDLTTLLTRLNFLAQAMENKNGIK